MVKKTSTHRYPPTAPVDTTPFGARRARVVVDGFGMAYSSLFHLRRLPISFIDISCSFTLKLTEGPEDAAIVSALVNLAHALDCEVTAEGVETAEQLLRLRELGCYMAQGHYLLKPSSSAEVSAFMAASCGGTG